MKNQNLKFNTPNSHSKFQILNSKFISETGFTLIESLIVMTIIAVLLVTATAFFYGSTRASYLLDQAAQELVGETRITKSQVLSVQQIGTGAGAFIPKAGVIEVTTNNTPLQVFYLRPRDPLIPCLGATLVNNKSFSISNRATIRSITDSSGGTYNSLYLIYTSPIGRFYTTSGNPNGNFEDYSINQSCRPSAALRIDTSGIERFIITLESTDNRGRMERVEINAQTGEVTIAK